MASEGLFEKLPDEIVSNIMEHLDLESLSELDSLEVRFSALLPNLKPKTIDLRGKLSSVPGVVKFLLDGKVPVKALHLPAGKYSDDAIDCIEKLLVYNGDRLEELTLPPLKSKLQEGRLVAATTHCTKLKHLDVRRHPANKPGGKKVDKQSGISNALRKVIIKNKTHLVYLRLQKLDGLTDVKKIFEAVWSCGGIKSFVTDGEYKDLLMTLGFQIILMEIIP